MGIALWSAPGQYARDALKELAFEFVDAPTVRVPTGVGLEAPRRGSIYFVNYETWRIFRLTPSTGDTEEVRLSGVPPDLSASIAFVYDLGVDADGKLYVPANWRLSGVRLSGFLVFDRRGRYLRAVRLEPSLWLFRHIAVEDGGDLIALGAEGGSLSRRGFGPCYLLHKYSSEGLRRTAFSRCPPEPKPDPFLRGYRDPRLDEPARSQIWIQDGLLHHLLPVSRLIRVFDLEGTPVREISLDPPPASHLLLRRSIIAGPDARVEITRLLPLPDGRLLALWKHSSVSYWSLQDRDGLPLSQATDPRFPPPEFVDDAGDAYFRVRRFGERAHLGRARIVLR